MHSGPRNTNALAVPLIVSQETDCLRRNAAGFDLDLEFDQFTSMVQTVVADSEYVTPRRELKARK